MASKRKKSRLATRSKKSFPQRCSDRIKRWTANEVQLQFSQLRKDFVENHTSNLTCKESLEKCLQLLMFVVITRYIFIILNSISAVIEVASNNLYFSEYLIKD